MLVEDYLNKLFTYSDVFIDFSRFKKVQLTEERKVDLHLLLCGLK